jgi:hypothetical protein
MGSEVGAITVGKKTDEGRNNVSYETCSRTDSCVCLQWPLFRVIKTVRKSALRMVTGLFPVQKETTDFNKTKIVSLRPTFYQHIYRNVSKMVNTQNGQQQILKTCSSVEIKGKPYI